VHGTTAQTKNENGLYLTTKETPMKEGREKRKQEVRRFPLEESRGLTLLPSQRKSSKRGWENPLKQHKKGIWFHGWAKNMGEKKWGDWIELSVEREISC